MVFQYFFVLHPIPICNQINLLSEKSFVAFFDPLCLVGEAFSMVKFIRLRIFACAARLAVSYGKAVVCGFFSNWGLHLAIQRRKSFDPKSDPRKDDVTPKQAATSSFDLCSTRFKKLKDHG